MNSWFDTYNVDTKDTQDLKSIRRKYDQNELKESASRLNEIILEE